MSVAFLVGKWFGLNLSSVLFATAIAIIAGILTFFPLRKRMKAFWQVVICVWFLCFSWKILELISGYVFRLTANAGKSLGIGIIIALIVAITPLILNKVLKTKAAKWGYSLTVIIIAGFTIPIIEIIL
jgi:hypothetical protein